jgi:hypothetical protein
MGVQNENSVSYAAQQLLNPQPEQVTEEAELQTNPEEETLEAVDESLEENVDREVGDEVVGDSDEDDYTDEETIDTEDEVASTDNEETDQVFYTVKVDGEEYEVNQEELIKGYQLEQNYTKKNTALLEKEAQLRQTEEQLSAERDKYVEINARLVQQESEQLSKAQAKLESISREEDPVGYVTQQLEVQEIAKGIEGKRLAWEAAQTEKQAQDNQRMQQYIEEQNNVLSQRLPEWSDPEKGQALKGEIAAYAQSIGYAPEVISNIKDAVDIIVLNKAMQLDKLEKKKGAIAKKRGPTKSKPVVRSKAKRSASAVKAQATKQKRETLKRSGKVGDAAELILQSLNK